MLKHACALLASTVISASVCGVVGEIIWSSGPYAFVSASMWLVGVAAIVSPVAYVVVALVRHDARMLRKESGAEKRGAIRPIAVTTCAEPKGVMAEPKGVMCELLTKRERRLWSADAKEAAIGVCG